MIVVGVLLTAVSFAAAILASRPRSIVLKRLAQMTPRADSPHVLGALLVTRQLAQSGLGWREGELVRAKIVGGLLGAALAAVVGLVAPIGPLVLLVAGYAGFVLPTLYVDRVAARRRSEAARSLVTLIEWTEALVASGRPVETAVVSLAEASASTGLTENTIAAAARSYALGAPLFPALAREASSVGLSALASIANDLERARDLGRGALVVLREHRDRLRASERAASLEIAGRVEGRLMLVLVLCYLPALMLLVVIPLFLGLLDGLFV